MPRFYVEKDGEWNIFSTITDDFILDEFVCLDALKARLLYERYKELTEDIDSLLTDKPRVNVMDYEEAVNRRKTESDSEKPNNSKEKPNNSKVSERPTGSTRSKMEQVDKDINVRSKERSSE